MTFDEILTLYASGTPAVKDGAQFITKCPLCTGYIHLAKKKGATAILCRGNGCALVDILGVYKLTLDDLKPEKNGHKPKKTKAAPAPAQDAPPADQAVDASGKPLKQIICVVVKDLPVLNAQCWRAIAEQDDPPCLFTRSNGIIRVRYDYHDDAAIVEPIDTFILRHELSKFAEWVGKKGKTVDPPVWLVKEVIASRVVPLPRFSRVTTVPVFAPDGSLITQPGYNKASGVIYAPPRGYESLPVPETITSADLDEAKKLVEELLQDFPFASDDAGDSADHDNAVALMLLPFVRDMIDAPTPLHLFEASMPGSGKGLLAKVLLWPAFGRVEGMPLDEEEAEVRKIITSAIHKGAPLIWFDNINHPIASSSLAAALTMDAWNDRVLGASELANAKIRAIWIAAANNVTLSGEIARRTIRMRIAPLTDRPEDRTGFLHDNLIEWVAENRPRLVWAAHVICKNAIQRGLPKPKSKVVASFERWSRVMGSILECAGYTQFLKNYRVLLDASNTERQALSIFAITWHEWAEREGRQFATTSELVPIADGVDGIFIAGKTDRARQISLGKWLASKHEVVTEYVCDDPSKDIGTYRFRIMNRGSGKGKNRGSQVWEVELLETLDK